MANPEPIPREAGKQPGWDANPQVGGNQLTQMKPTWPCREHAKHHTAQDWSTDSGPASCSTFITIAIRSRKHVYVKDAEFTTHTPTNIQLHDWHFTTVYLGLVFSCHHRNHTFQTEHLYILLWERLLAYNHNMAEWKFPTALTRKCGFLGALLTFHHCAKSAQAICETTVSTTTFYILSRVVW